MMLGENEARLQMINPNNVEKYVGDFTLEKL